MKKLLGVLAVAVLMLGSVAYVATGIALADTEVDSVSIVLDKGLEKGTYKVESKDKGLRCGSVMILDAVGETVRFATTTSDYYSYIYVDPSEGYIITSDNLTFEKVSSEDLGMSGDVQHYTEKAVEDYTESELAEFFA